jgi:glutamine synthetase
VDSSSNPFLTIAALLRAGLDGVRNKIDPGPPQEGNTYELLQQGVDIEKVPDSLGAALEELAKDEVVLSAMPGRLYKVFEHYKRDEWERYLAAVTDWERDEYLEVLP